MAEGTHSPELREGFMRLAVLYEELAEYVANTGDASPDGAGPSGPDRPS